MVIARSLDPRKWIAGTLLDRPLIQAMFRDKQGQMEAESPDGIRRLISYTKTKRTPWLIYVGIPTATALAPARESLLRLGWFGAMTVLIALGLAAWISRYIAKPIQQLSLDVQRFSSGDLAHRRRSGRQLLAAGPFTRS